MQLVLFLTLLEVAFGMSVVHCFIPRSALGPGFGKTISASIFFCLLFPFLLAAKLLPWVPESDLLQIRAGLSIGIGIWFAYFVVLNYPREGIQFILTLAATIVQMGLMASVSIALARRFYSPGATGGFGPSIQQLRMAIGLGMTTSSLLLGTVTMGMLIGHWYLVIPGLAIKWLKGSCVAFGAAIVLKSFSIVLSLWIGANSDPFGPQGFFDRYIMANITIFVLRLMVGVILPALLAYMAYEAAAIRSTQSSTGILFPAMIIVFLGEMIGSYLIIGLSGLPV